jgi:hypothetical protein
MPISSVIVDDCHVVRIRAVPSEAHPPLVIDSNTVLPLSIAAKFLQPIARRHPQLVERFRRVDGDELTEHDAPEIRREPPDRFSGKQPLGVAIAEGLDHQG